MSRYAKGEHTTPQAVASPYPGLPATLDVGHYDRVREGLPKVCASCTHSTCIEKGSGYRESHAVVRPMLGAKRPSTREDCLDARICGRFLESATRLLVVSSLSGELAERRRET